MNSHDEPAARGNGHKRFKWEPLALFFVVTVIGIAFVAGGERTEARIGPFRGVLEQQYEGEESLYRIRFRNDETSAWLTAEQLVGKDQVAEFHRQRGNQLFQFLNITSWWALGWIVIGLLGQGVFMGRMIVQWIVSERRKESVVPPIFWYLSLVGGLMLFTYFVWRQDIVGVLGQTSGVAIYLRNIRLIAKHRHKEQQ